MNLPPPNALRIPVDGTLPFRLPRCRLWYGWGYFLEPPLFIVYITFNELGQRSKNNLKSHLRDVYYLKIKNKIIIQNPRGIFISVKQSVITYTDVSLSWMFSLCKMASIILKFLIDILACTLNSIY